MIGYTILLIFSLIFFLCQVDNTSTLGTTDVNNYIYIAKLLGEGKILYKDIFLDNFPLATYIGFFYRTITFGNMHLFKLTATIEGLAITWLLYWYFSKKTKSMPIGLLVAFTFCSSFVFLRTALDQSGVYTALLFFTLSYIFWERKAYVKSGVFSALSILTKAYMFPLGLSLFVATVIQKRDKTARFTLAGIVTALVVMLPTIFLAFPQFIDQTIHYGLVRAVIEDKIYIIQMFKYDLLIIGLFISGWFLRKHSLHIWLMSLFTPLFFIFYKDFYYVYFGMIVLVATFITGEWLSVLKTHKYSKQIFIVYGCILGVILLHHSFFLIQYSTEIKTLPESEKLLEAIKKEKPDALYTYAYIGNGISYLTDIPPLKNYIDITANQFKSNILDKSKITKEVLNSRTLIMVFAFKKDSGVILDPNIIDTEQLKTPQCKIVYTHPLISNHDIVTKYVALIRCYK